MSVNNLANLSQMTGLSQAELAKRAEQLVDAKTGKVSALSALDAALAQALLGSGPTMESFTAAGAASARPHTIDEPVQAFSHAQPMAGFAPEAPAPPSIGGPAALLEKAAKLGAGRISGFCGSCYQPPAVNAPEGGNNGGGGVVVVSPPASQVSPPAPPASSSPPAVSPLGFATSSAPVSLAKKGFAGAPPATTGAAAGGQAPSNSTIGTDTAAVQGQLDTGSMAIQFEVLKNQMARMAEMQNLITNTMSAMHEQAMTAIRNVKA